jgi:hypothetical protein
MAGENRLIQNLVPGDIEHVLHLKGDFAILNSAIKRCVKVRADMMMITEN